MNKESRWPTEVTRRRVLGGVMTIGAASAAAGAGTFALFDDSETSSNNTISAGTLDLSVGGDGSNAVMTLTKVEPGESGQDTASIRNAGTMPGYLRFGIVGFRTPENGVNEPESKADAESDPLGANSGSDHSGELAQHLLVRMKLSQEDSDDIYLVGNDSSYVQASQIWLGPRDLSTLLLSAEESVTFVTEYKLPSEVTNEVQSDSVEIDLHFALVQEKSQSVLPGAEEISAEAVDPSDGSNAGIEFNWTNDFGQEATITDVHVQPDSISLVLLSDQEHGTDYEDFDYNADLHIETPSGDQDGWVDGGPSKFDIPGWLDLDADGWGTVAEQEAILSDGNEGTVNLYAFRDGSGSKVDMTGKTVRVTFDVRLQDGTKTYVPLVMTPE